VLATELAYSLNRKFVRRALVNDHEPAVEINLVVPDDEHILADMLPAELAVRATAALREQGVKVGIEIE
jgi:NADH dehydrogenase FAD-containing subunit